jgi:hypothetical protein
MWILWGVLGLTASGVQAADVTWTNAASGNWSDGGNWSTGSPPGASDNAIITLDGTYTVNLNVNATVASLNLGGSSGTHTLKIADGTMLTLDGDSTVGTGHTLHLGINQTFYDGTVSCNGKLTVNGTCNLVYGFIRGDGSFLVNGSLNILGNWRGNEVGARTVTLKGTTTWTGGNINCSNGTVLQNQTGALFDIQTDDQIVGSGVFDNAGTVTKSAGAGTAWVQLPFNNTGTVNANSGVLMLSGGGTGSGTFNAAVGCNLDFGGNHTWNDGATFSGQGVTRIRNGGTVSTAGAGAGATLSAGHTLQIGLDANWEDGTLSGSGKLTVNGT